MFNYFRKNRYDHYPSICQWQKFDCFLQKKVNRCSTWLVINRPSNWIKKYSWDTKDFILTRLLFVSIKKISTKWILECPKWISESEYVWKYLCSIWAHSENDPNYGWNLGTYLWSKDKTSINYQWNRRNLGLQDKKNLLNFFLQCFEVVIKEIHNWSNIQHY